MAMELIMNIIDSIMKNKEEKEETERQEKTDKIYKCWNILSFPECSPRLNLPVIRFYCFWATFAGVKLLLFFSEIKTKQN